MSRKPVLVFHRLVCPEPLVRVSGGLVIECETHFVIVAGFSESGVARPQWTSVWKADRQEKGVDPRSTDPFRRECRSTGFGESGDFANHVAHSS